MRTGAALKLLLGVSDFREDTNSEDQHCGQNIQNHRTNAVRSCSKQGMHFKIHGAHLQLSAVTRKYLAFF